MHEGITYVIYKGGSTSSLLRKGRMYEIEFEYKDEKNGHISYKLKDISGWHDSDWFKSPVSYLVLVKEHPKKGERMKNYLCWKNGTWEKFISSSPIKKVIPITNTMYQLLTDSNLFLAQVDPLLK